MLAPALRPVARAAARSLAAPLPRRARRSLAAALLSLPLLAACEPGAVDWQGELARQPAVPDSALATLAFDSTGTLASGTGGPIVRPVDYAGRSCDASVRFATVRDRLGRELTAAAWWSLRPDSSARLLAAVSASRGATWTPAAPVDTVDRSALGCARPAPSVAIEPGTGYVHVAYWLQAPEGPGVFFSHSMDEGATFHAPVPLVYGERPAATGIAASGDTLAIVYEDPNAAQPRIGLALSKTQGHLFERKGILVSPKNERAERPLVGLRHGRLVVGWLDRGAGEIVVRRGVIRALERGD